MDKVVNLLTSTGHMARFLKKKKEDIGLSPDDISFRGERKVDEVIMRVIDYNATTMVEKEISAVEEVKKFKEDNTVTWFNVDGLHNTQIIEEIANVFHLDRMVLAEVMNINARPTVVEFDNCIFISIKMIQEDAGRGMFSVENLSLVVMDSVLISFQERRGDVFEPVRERIRKEKKRIRNGKTDYLAFALLDIVIDNYLYVLSALGEKIELLEDKLLVNPRQVIVNEINNYKRELNFLRKNIKPAREMVIALSKLDSELIEYSTDVHFRELQDNLSQASDASDSYREILSDQLNIYHTSISSRLNDIMKFLTVFSVIFIPLTFIAGIYGTNFDFVPELHYKYSYFVMWGVIITVATGMLLYFRKKKWL